jgi:ubiquinone/menaquinone biosynthesis C-methylase UbiE
MPQGDATTRFSDRVEHYIKSRPHYPPALLEFMRDRLGFTPGHVVADVGSGTGILTEMLLKHGNVVYAVEPNEPMRRAAEQLLAGRYPNFRSIAGTAEATTLRDRSVDFVTAGQAFHWFEPDRARAEFRRILRPGGWVALVWNDRRLDRPAFALGYEQLVRRYNTDLDKINHRNVTKDESEALRRFFDGEKYENVNFDNPQTHDWEGVRARLLSSSYMPLSDDPRYEAMLGELRVVFDAHERGGRVVLEYDTRVYFGQLSLPLPF